VSAMEVALSMPEETLALTVMEEAIKKAFWAIMFVLLATVKAGLHKENHAPTVKELDFTNM